MANRVNLADRHDVFAEDVNHISDLLIYEIIQRYRGILAEDKSYVLKGLDVLPGPSGNDFVISAGLGVTNSGEIVDVRQEIGPFDLADLNVGGITVVTIGYEDVPGIVDNVDRAPLDFFENAVGDGTITLGNGIEVPVTPRPQVGKDEDDPSNTILPTRIYGGFRVFVETQAAWNALDQDVKDARIKLRRLATPPASNGGPGTVDPGLIQDPEFPTTVVWNMPPNSIPLSAIIDGDKAIAEHQREAHVNFIFGDPSEASLLAEIDALNTSTINVPDVIADRSYYVNGRRYEAGDLASLSVQFNPVSDASGTYVIYVHSDGTATGIPSLEYGIGVENEGADMPVATVRWDQGANQLSDVVDVRNFVSVDVQQAVFDFIGPLLALFGTGYFRGLREELLAKASPSVAYDVQISPGAGLVRNNDDATAIIVDLPSGTILSAEEPDAFPQTDLFENVVADPGDPANRSIDYQLSTNGAPPHKVRNLVFTLGASTLTEGNDYVLNDDTGSFYFKFGFVGAGSDVTATYEYALPRFDVVALSRVSGEFSIVKGTPGQSPAVPTLGSDLVEWAILSVEEFADGWNDGDLTPGSGYIPLPFGFNLPGNKLGIGDLYLALGELEGVTGENLPSTGTQTINERFESIESTLGLLGPGAIQFRLRHRLNWRSPIDLKSFDPIVVCRKLRFVRFSEDLTDETDPTSPVTRLRFVLAYRENIPNSKNINLYLRVINDQNNQPVVTSMPMTIPTENVIGTDPVDGISHFYTSWYTHPENIDKVRVEMYLNNTKQTLTNASDAGKLTPLEAELLDLHCEAWLFPSG